MDFLLRDGPGDGMTVPSTAMKHGEVRMLFAHLPPIKMMLHVGKQAVQPHDPPREGIYLVADNESGDAKWFGWADEVSTANPAMVEALGNASDDEILALMDSIEQLRKR